MACLWNGVQCMKYFIDHYLPSTSSSVSLQNTHDALFDGILWKSLDDTSLFSAIGGCIASLSDTQPVPWIVSNVSCGGSGGGGRPTTQSLAEKRRLIWELEYVVSQSHMYAWPILWVLNAEDIRNIPEGMSCVHLQTDQQLSASGFRVLAQTLSQQVQWPILIVANIPALRTVYLESADMRTIVRDLDLHIETFERQCIDQLCVIYSTFKQEVVLPTPVSLPLVVLGTQGGEMAFANVRGFVQCHFHIWPLTSFFQPYLRQQPPSPPLISCRQFPRYVGTWEKVNAVATTTTTTSFPWILCVNCTNEEYEQVMQSELAKSAIRLWTIHIRKQPPLQPPPPQPPLHHFATTWIDWKQGTRIMSLFPFQYIQRHLTDPCCLLDTASSSSSSSSALSPPRTLWIIANSLVQEKPSGNGSSIDNAPMFILDHWEKMPMMIGFWHHIIHQQRKQQQQHSYHCFVYLPEEWWNRMPRILQWLRRQMADASAAITKPFFTLFFFTQKQQTDFITLPSSSSSSSGIQCKVYPIRR